MTRVPRVRTAVGAAALASYRTARRVRGHAFSRAVSGGFAEFGRHSVLDLPVDIRGARSIAIGAYVWVGPGSWLYAMPEDATDEPVLVVGDGVRISGNCVLSAVASVRLGRDVLLARNVYISDHSHAYEDITRPIHEQGLTNVLPVTVGDGAWLGQGVVVCPGVEIGRGAVVGAGSVVRHDVPAHTVAVGAPARVVRSFGPSERLPVPA
jgi:carbonic anhydrase/acetyltransferase-like protein (isoleucine patch superfamily)